MSVAESMDEGTGNSKAELAELSADASPLELGDWLAVCGPVLRDISPSQRSLAELDVEGGPMLL